MRNKKQKLKTEKKNNIFCLFQKPKKMNKKL